MRAQHEVVLYVDARPLWLTRQEIPGKCSQNCNVKLTRLFLSCEGAAALAHETTNIIIIHIHGRPYVCITCINHI